MVNEPNSSIKNTGASHTVGTPEQQADVSTARIANIERLLSSLTMSFEGIDSGERPMPAASASDLRKLNYQLEILQNGHTELNQLAQDILSRLRSSEEILKSLEAEDIPLRVQKSEEALGSIPTEDILMRLQKSQEILSSIPTDDILLRLKKSEEVLNLLPALRAVDESTNQRLDELGLKVQSFFDSLNYLNRFQLQLDALNGRFETHEKMLREIEEKIGSGVNVKFDAIGQEHNMKFEALRSEHTNYHSDSNAHRYSIESRLNSLEHTMANFVSPKLFFSAVKRKFQRKFGKSS